MRRAGGDEGVPAGERPRRRRQQARAIAASISAGSASRPGPLSGSAMAPLVGAGDAHAARRAASPCWRGWPGASHIAGFIAGATSTGARVASSTVVARSSASPCAIFARRSARGGRHHHQVRPARQADMADLGLRRPEVVMHALRR